MPHTRSSWASFSRAAAASGARISGSWPGSGALSRKNTFGRAPARLCRSASSTDGQGVSPMARAAAVAPMSRAASRVCSCSKASPLSAPRQRARPSRLSMSEYRWAAAARWGWAGLAAAPWARLRQPGPVVPVLYGAMAWRRLRVSWRRSRETAGRRPGARAPAGYWSRVISAVCGHTMTVSISAALRCPGSPGTTGTRLTSCGNCRAVGDECAACRAVLG